MLQQLFNKVNRERGSAGFTLIELLIVVVIIGILAAIAIPQFSSTKEKAYVASMKSDLRNLATAQESYFATNNQYMPATTDPATVSGSDFSWSEGVEGATVAGGSTTGWSATADHDAVDGDGTDCGIYFGSVSAPSISGVDSPDPGAPYCAQ